MGGWSVGRRDKSVRNACATALLALSLLAPAVASAHVERSAYWPDPARDCSVTPCAGGAVPAVRSLSSALDRGTRAETRVVCRPDSLQLAQQSIARARSHGYDVRPTDHRELSARQATELLALNRRLVTQC